jgi:hypothetical protein
MSNPNHYYPKYGGWKGGQGNASICTLVCTLDPPPVCICICQGKAVRDFSIFFFKGCFHLQYLPMKKENFESQAFSLQIWRFKNSRVFSQCPCPHFHPSKRYGQGFLQFLFCCAFWLKYLSLKKKHAKIQQLLRGVCTKHLYYFGVTRCTSTAFYIINSKILRQWRQEFYWR